MFNIQLAPKRCHFSSVRAAKHTKVFPAYGIGVNITVVGKMEQPIPEDEAGVGVGHTCYSTYTEDLECLKTLKSPNRNG